jgi:hypothetical protein
MDNMALRWALVGLVVCAMGIFMLVDSSGNAGMSVLVIGLGAFAVAGWNLYQSLRGKQ